MTQKTESKWQTLRRFLEGYMQKDTTYRAGAIYEAYLNEGGSAEISRKDFEMFLRDQVMKDDGMLKRTSHGIYEIRTDQSDRGVFFTRGSQSTEQPSIDLADDGADLSEFEQGVADFGIRKCEDVNQFNALLKDLGEDAYDIGYIPPEEESEGMGLSQ